MHALRVRISFGAWNAKRNGEKTSFGCEFTVGISLLVRICRYYKNVQNVYIYVYFVLFFSMYFTFHVPNRPNRPDKLDNCRIKKYLLDRIGRRRRRREAGREDGIIRY